jgi:hypothetical protein
MVLIGYGQLGVTIIYLGIIVGIANICLLAVLIKSFKDTYKDIKSKFTIGLLYFSTFLLLQNIISLMFIILPLLLPLQNITEWSEIPLILINLVQLAALISLLKIIRG